MSNESEPVDDCLSDDALVAVLDGSSSLIDSRLEAHLHRCAECRSMIAAMQRVSLRSRSASSARALDEPTPVQRMGRYLLLEKLGAGGMGIVHAAYDPDLDRKVALKRLRPGLGLLQERALLEAQAMARVTHPNTVSVFDVGVSDGELFIAMELVDGPSLRGWLSAGNRSDEEIIRIFLQAGAGLAAAHRTELIHGDFKPDNVLVGADGRVKVSDFGLSRIANDWEPAFASTQSSVDGTPEYLAPERRHGGASSALADQFSYCLSFKEALETLPASALSRRALRILARGLEEDPSRRYPDLETLQRVLEAATRPRWKRHSLLAGACVATLVAVSVVRARPEVSCETGEEALGTFWNESSRAAIRRALAQGSKPLTESITNLVLDRIHAYAGAWNAADRAGCMARGPENGAEGRSSPQAACLDRRKAELSIVVGLLENPGVVPPGKALELIATLSPISECNQASPAVPLRPSDSKLAARVDSTAAELIRVRVLLQAGEVARAVPLSAAALEAARATGYGPLVAEALMIEGLVAADGGRFAAAKVRYVEAARTAALARDVRIVASSYIYLVGLSAASLEQPDEALVWSEAAAAMLAYIGEDRRLESRLAHAIGTAYSLKADLDRAQSQYERVLALNPPGSAESASIRRYGLQSLASVLRRRGDLEGAQARLEEAYALMREAFGDAYPALSEVLNSLGVLALDQRQAERALQLFKRAGELLAQSEVQEHHVAVFVHNQGDALRALGRLDEAERSYRSAIERAGRSLPSDHPRLAQFRASLGALLVARKRFDEGIALLREGEEALRRARGATHPVVLRVQKVLREARRKKLERRGLGANSVKIDGSREATP